MSEDFELLVPFGELINDDGWRMFFPFTTAHHHGLKIDFTKERGERMVDNFGRVPDYKLPINTLHDDALGIYGFITDMRVGEKGVEWLPAFNDGAEERLKDKGYLYASPEVAFSGFTEVKSGVEYEDVALGIAITPRPRLGAVTRVFYSEDGWRVEEKDSMDEELLNKFKEEIVAKFAEQVENAEKPGIEEFAESVRAEIRLALEEKDAEMVKLSEENAKLAQEKVTLAEAVAELEFKYSETSAKMAEEREAKEAAILAQRRSNFSDVGGEITGLPVETSEFADVMIELEDYKPELHGKVLDMLQTMGKRIAEGKLFEEFGGEGDGQTITQKVDNGIKRIVEGRGVDVGTATKMFFKENPGMYVEYNQEVVKVVK